MAVEMKRRMFSVRDYYKMGKAGILNASERVELIEGEIVEMSPIGVPHASTVGRITQLFARALSTLAQIWVQNPLRLGDRSEPVPDIMLLRLRADSYASGHPTAADVLLLIEVSDTTLGFDQRIKLPLYARQGVPEVWIADVNGGIILTYRDPSEEGYRIAKTYSRGERIAIALIPGVDFAVDDILG